MDEKPNKRLLVVELTEVKMGLCHMKNAEKLQLLIETT